LTLRTILYAADGVLRAPWRLVAFALALVACTVIAEGVGALFVDAGLASTDGRMLVFTSTQLLALLGAHWIALRRVDRLPWRTVGLGAEAASPRRLAFGFALGALAIGVPSAILLAAHLLAIVRAPAGSAWLAAAGRVTLFLAPAALVEELLLRGYVFAVLRAAWGWPATLLVTSVVFGLLHLRNPGASAESVALVALAGVFLGAILVATGSLYAAWMAHWAWNWTMAVVLHAAVSGQPFESPGYRVVDAGPDWLTGGGWGPEGGAAAGLGMLAGVSYLSLLLRRRDGAGDTGGVVRRLLARRAARPESPSSTQR
jgi:membrane protease YdiL (CAAX protease family)